MTVDTHPHNKQARVLAIKLMREGIITTAEAARLGNVSRSAANQWALNAGLDPVLARWRYVSRVWKRKRKEANDE